jgi:hypothetical protein
MVIFHASIREHLDGPQHVLYGIPDGDLQCIVLPSDGTDRWGYARPVDAEEAASAPDDALMTERIRKAAGIPDLGVRITSTHTFEMGASLAERMRRGRVLLVGDAAHRMTPAGAVGMNSAMHAAHNLGWKLAYVIRGLAGDALLDTYEAERRPIGERNARRSIGEEPERSPESIDVDLGYVYESGAVVPERNPMPSTPDVMLDGRPGSLAPHFWLQPGISCRDVFGRDFTLLTGPDGHAWRDAASAMDVSIAMRSFAGTEWLQRYGIESYGAVLVRPDGFIAWRSESLGRNPATDLRAVMSQVLAQ